MQVYLRRIELLLELIYLEISDQFTADEALNNFEGDFDSIDGYDKHFALFFFFK
jgi:hypothetical protein